MTNMAFQINDVAMFAMGQKELGSPTGNQNYDDLEESVEILAFNIGMFALINPRFWSDTKQNFISTGNKIFGKDSVNVEVIFDSASQPKKGGETIAGHALQKHAGRNPHIWGESQWEFREYK